MKVLLLSVLVTVVTADVYLHVPRGSNNRLNEKSAERANANRLFDSQNNNRGGYNHGDSTDQPSGNDEGKQYRMHYFQSGRGNAVQSGGRSIVRVEWTNQHGCGGDDDSDPHKQNCNIVLQYMCQEDSPTGSVNDGTLRNGVQTTTQEYDPPPTSTETEAAAAAASRDGDVKTTRGLHEPWENYDACYTRERNKGLFTADQVLTDASKLGYSGAIYTRQNPNGDRSGYECPEERDYFPYWHPTPWKDIAVLAENETMCSHYQSKSFNVHPYHLCVEYWNAAKTRRKHFSRWNNEADCQQNGGDWTLLHNYLEKASGLKSRRACEGEKERVWGVAHDSSTGQPECLVTLPAPHCTHAPWSRSNHLGNGRQGEVSHYDWTLPYFPSEKTQRCVFRIRYNISTDDYDPYHTDHTHNTDKGRMSVSPVQQNPYVRVARDTGGASTPLRLAINTAQFGRTFQDRSHVFKLLPRPASVPHTSRIFNLNVRGKRGNIVQTYPAVEYDFSPTNLELTTEDLVHIQWTGSNTHNNGNPAGDGQAGDAGEGTTGTDRSNVVEMGDREDNFPLPFESTTLWEAADVVWHSARDVNLSPKDLALGFASAGYYGCMKASDCADAVETKAALNVLLNNAPASYMGALLRFPAPARFHIMCTRNNNFSNRSQKASIVVVKA